MAPRIYITLPFFITCFGSLFKNYYFEGGWKSLFATLSKLLIFYELDEFYNHFYAILSTTLKNTPLGYLCFNT